MFPLILLIPGTFLLWQIVKRGGFFSASREPFINSSPLLPRPSSTAADYLRHLHEATAAARVLDTVKPQALQADITSLMRASDDVSRALAILSAPIAILDAQKDLNVLGASPPLAENGVMTSSTVEAIKGIQAHFNQPVTGRIDASTAVAIRYGVGCIHSQDRGML